MDRVFTTDIRPWGQHCRRPCCVGSIGGSYFSKVRKRHFLLLFASWRWYKNVNRTIFTVNGLVVWEYPVVLVGASALGAVLARNEFSLKHTPLKARTFLCLKCNYDSAMSFCLVLTHPRVVTLITCIIHHKQMLTTDSEVGCFLFFFFTAATRIQCRALLIVSTFTTLMILYLTAPVVSAAGRLGKFWKSVHSFNLPRMNTHMWRVKTWRKENVAKMCLLIVRRSKLANVFACVSLMSTRVWRTRSAKFFQLFFYISIIDSETPQWRQCE